MLQDNHTNFYFGQVPRYGQPPKPIEFEVDQAMLIRLISLMSKLLKLPNILKTVPFRHIVSVNFRYEVITGLSFDTLTFDLS